MNVRAASGFVSLLCPLHLDTWRAPELAMAGASYALGESVGNELE